DSGGRNSCARRGGGRQDNLRGVRGAAPGGLYPLPRREGRQERKQEAVGPMSLREAYGGASLYQVALISYPSPPHRGRGETETDHRNRVLGIVRVHNRSSPLGRPLPLPR